MTTPTFSQNTKRQYYFCQKCAVYHETMFLNWGIVPGSLICPVCNLQFAYATSPPDDNENSDYRFFWYRPTDAHVCNGSQNFDKDKMYLANGGLLLTMSCDVNKLPLTFTEFDVMEAIVDSYIEKIKKMNDLQTILDNFHELENNVGTIRER